MLGHLEELQEKSWRNVQKLTGKKGICYDLHNPNVHNRTCPRVSA